MLEQDEKIQVTKKRRNKKALPRLRGTVDYQRVSHLVPINNSYRDKITVAHYKRKDTAPYLPACKRKKKVYIIPFILFTYSLLYSYPRLLLGICSAPAIAEGIKYLS